jgi:hypothetical protein
MSTENSEAISLDIEDIVFGIKTNSVALAA